MATNPAETSGVKNKLSRASFLGRRVEAHLTKMHSGLPGCTCHTCMRLQREVMWEREDRGYGRGDEQRYYTD